MPLNTVSLGLGYYPDFNIGRPIFYAQIYIGLPDTDPTIESNQKDVWVRDSYGIESAVPQPVLTDAGGVPVHLNSPVQILVEGEPSDSYSMTVQNKQGKQIYHVPNSDKFGLTTYGRSGLLITIDEVLIDGQLLVDFGVDLSLASMHISGLLADNGRLVLDTGYTVSGTEVTLANSYPAGTILTATYNDNETGSEEYVNVVGDTMTGPLIVPAGATGAEVPQVAEVVQKSGDSMSGPLTVADGGNNVLIAAAAGLQLLYTGLQRLILTVTGATLTGEWIADTQTPADNSTKLATTAYVDAAVAVDAVPSYSNVELWTGSISTGQADLSQPITDFDSITIKAGEAGNYSYTSIPSTRIVLDEKVCTMGKIGGDSNAGILYIFTEPNEITINAATNGFKLVAVWGENYS